MKKITALLTAVALLGSNAAFAQTGGTGKAATASRNTASSNGFAWGIGLGALAVLGIVVGFTCGMAAGNNSH